MSLQRSTVWRLALLAAGLAGILYVWLRRPEVPPARSLPKDSQEAAAMATMPPGASNVSRRSTQASDQALAAALAGIAKETVPDRQTAALARLANEIPTSEIPAALIASAAKSSRLDAEFRQLLIRRWTQEDASGAASWIDKHFSGAARGSALESVAGAWAETDAAAAEEWARLLMNPDERGSALLAIAGELTRDNPVAALSLAAELPPGRARDEFLEHAASEWAGRDSSQAIEWGKQIGDEALRAQMLAAIAVGFAEKDPAAAATLATESLPAGRVQDDAVVSVVQRWVQQDPKLAASWVTEFPSGELRDTALEALVKLWADQDLAGAGEWLNTIAERPGSDAAIAAYVEKVSVRFPEMAAVRAQKIENARLRDERMIGLAELWLRQDAAAARQWIGKAPFSADERSRLLALPGK